MTLARTPKLFIAGIASVLLLSSCAAKKDEKPKAITPTANRVAAGSLKPTEWKYRVTTYASMPIPWRYGMARDSIVVQIYNLDKAVDSELMLRQILRDMRWNHRHRPIVQTVGDTEFKNAVLKVHSELYENAVFVETALY